MGEVCSGGTPYGLYFEGASLSDVFLDLGSHPTLVGGTQRIRLQYDPGTGGRDLDLPYLADDEGASGVEVAGTSGPVVTLRGTGQSSNYLRITDLDGTLFDRKQFEGVSLAEIRIVPHGEIVAAGESVVFVPGALDLTVALIGAGGQRAIDESMAIAIPGGTRTRWDALHVPAATIGHLELAVTAGGRPEAAIDVEVVTGPDSLVPQAPTDPLVAGRSSVVCFSAHHAGRHVARLDWTFAVDHGTADKWLFTNCTTVIPERTGLVNVTASAGGLTVVASYPVSAQLRSTAVSVGHTSTTAGERASAY